MFIERIHYCIVSQSVDCAHNEQLPTVLNAAFDFPNGVRKIRRTRLDQEVKRDRNVRDGTEEERRPGWRG